LSYARLDDKYEEGYITNLRERLENEVRMFTGDDFTIFQDRVDVKWGEEWAARIGLELHSVTFLFPILTPSFFKSNYCLKELQEFLDLERLAGRRDLILPIYYLESLVLEKAERREANPLAQILSTRQYVDWRDLRGASFRDPRARTRLATMARQIRDALDNTTATSKEQLPLAQQDPSPPNTTRSIKAETGPTTEKRSSGPLFYEDFILQISRSSDGDYILRVLRSPAGEVEAGIASEYALQEIEAINQALTKLRRGDDVKELGKHIFRLLFPPPVKTCFSRSLAYSGPTHGLRLGLRLGLEDPTVAPFWNLPWEYMFIEEEGTFLGLTRQILVNRVVDLPIMSRPPVRESPIRLLVVAINSHQYEPLDLDREVDCIKQAFASEPFEIEILRDITLAGMRDALLQREFHGLHFAGHGTFNRTSGEGRLVFGGVRGKAQVVSAPVLASVLRDFSSLRFAMLNTQGGKIASENSLGSTAAALLRAGLSAVVTHQAEITDDEAITFSKTFYSRLAAGDPIDVALVEGRLAIALSDLNSIGWGSPVLYTRVSDGRIFQPREREE
jgi:hypothetical protein